MRDSLIEIGVKKIMYVKHWLRSLSLLIYLVLLFICIYKFVLLLLPCYHVMMVKIKLYIYSVSHHTSMVIKRFILLGLAAEYRSRRWVWSTVVRRPSEVDDTHRRTKLTASETISHSRDMIGAQQNINGSRDLTTPFQGRFAIRWLALATSTYLPNLKSLAPLTTKT